MQIKEKITQIFFWMFSVCFAFVWVNAVFWNEYFKTTPLVITAAVCIILLAFIWRVLDKCAAVSEKQYKTILIVFAAVMFIAEFALALALRHDTWFDIGAIHKGAAEWVETGTFRSYYQYFCECPNNLGPMAFMFVIYKLVSFFGIKDYYAIASFVSAVMLVVAMLLSSLICKRLKDTKHALFALVLFAMSVQFYFMASAFYTDVLSMMFPVLCYWLYLKSGEYTGKKKALIYILIGLSAAIGSLNKFTVAISVIAIIIDIFMNGGIKEALKAGVCIASVMAVIMLSFNGYIYSKHISREMSEYYHRPYTHWVMMGLKGNGAYNGEDFTFTDNLPPETRTQRVNEETVSRIKNLGISGIYKLISVKSSMDYGDGTYGISDFLNINPETDTKLHDWVLYDGEHYNTYGVYATSMHIALMLLMIIGAVASALGKSETGKKAFAAYLAFFGVWLFLLCWETNRRYFSNFAPVMFILATIGMCSLDNAVKSVYKKLAGSGEQAAAKNKKQGRKNENENC